MYHLMDSHRLQSFLDLKKVANGFGDSLAVRNHVNMRMPRFPRDFGT